MLECYQILRRRQFVHQMEQAGYGECLVTVCEPYFSGKACIVLWEWASAAQSSVRIPTKRAAYGTDGKYATIYPDLHSF